MSFNVELTLNRDVGMLVIQEIMNILIQHNTQTHKTSLLKTLWKLGMINKEARRMTISSMSNIRLDLGQGAFAIAWLLRSGEFHSTTMSNFNMWSQKQVISTFRTLLSSAIELNVLNTLLMAFVSKIDKMDNEFPIRSLEISLKGRIQTLTPSHSNALRVKRQSQHAPSQRLLLIAFSSGISEMIRWRFIEPLSQHKTESLSQHKTENIKRLHDIITSDWVISESSL